MLTTSKLPARDDTQALMVWYERQNMVTTAPYYVPLRQAIQQEPRCDAQLTTLREPNEKQLMATDLIVNMQARQLMRDATLLPRMKQVADNRCELHVTHNLAELEKVCSTIAARGTDLVLLAGGDGTLTAGLSALTRHLGDEDLPTIAPIPAGTAGTVGRSWGIRGKPIARLERMLSTPASSRPKQTLAVELLDADDQACERRVGFIVGTGLIARFFRLYYQAGAPGYSGSAKVVAQVFFSSLVGGAKAREVLTPMPCTLTVNGVEQAPRAWSLICASVIRNLGLHMMLTYRAGQATAKPHLVASCLPPHRLGPQAPLVLAGRRLRGKNHVDTLAAETTVRFDGPDAFVLDGDLLEAHGFRVRPGPTIHIAS